MLAFSHDPDAGTLYVYFTELEAGQAVESLEYPAHLLLDAQGQVVGLRLDLDDELTLAQLELALDGDFGRLDMETGRLTILAFDEPPARALPLAETAILDLDGDETVLGVELAVPEELRTPAALARLAPLMVALDDEPTGPEGPVVLAPAEEAAQDQEGQGGQEDAQEAGEPGGPAPDEAEGAPAEPAGAPGLPRSSAGGASADTRSGFVALVGKPNVGKSTLLNALLGQKVAIVSPRPQTTRVPMRGILTRPGAQIVFVDTPGIHQPNHALGRLMVDLAEKTLPNADVIGFMVDISQPPSQLDRRIAAQVQKARGRKLLILNKVDVKPRGGRGYLEEYRALGAWELELAVSARRGLGLAPLLEAIVERLPAGPPLYPDEQLTDRSEQQLAAEFVREKVLYHTQHEVPHAVAVEVDEWEDREGATYIRMTINVERDGQKAIVIGAGGAMLKKIGTAARYEIERLVGRQVFLELWVKVRPNWRDDPSALGWLGYRARDFR
ncbi:MAG TPA: GTPase Era [Chloroflexaceae bacterium]|nr:GTPase Era [Chloroflexaceae bacterium]